PMNPKKENDPSPPIASQASVGAEVNGAGDRLASLEKERERLEKVCQELTQERDQLREELKAVRTERGWYIQSLYALIPRTPVTFDEQELAEMEKNPITLSEIIKEIEESARLGNGGTR